MHIALSLAKKAFIHNEVPVGAVVVRKNKIISFAHNLCFCSNNPLEHAEVLAIKNAQKALGRAFLSDCDLYVTLEPCAYCAGAIGLTRIKRLYFGAYDPKGGAVEHGGNILKQDLYITETIGGVQEKACSLLLKQFFIKIRNHK